MTEILPVRPACFGKSGCMNCPCSRLKTAQAIACIASRYMWIVAQNIADLPTNEDRKIAMALIERIKGVAFAKQVRAAAMELIAEQLVAA